MSDLIRLPAITLWQPWASLLAHGIKPHETRSWPAPPALVGERVAIHAAARPVRPRDLPALLERECYGSNLPPYNLPLGCLLGTARLTYSRHMSGVRPLSHADRIAGNWEPGRFAWRFEDHRPFVDPIPMRGRQRIWYAEIPREVVS